MRRFGLIGRPLGHSASAAYFTEKFNREGVTDCEYSLYELGSIGDLPGLLERLPELCGLNVTIPYKRDVMAFLDSVSPEAEAIGAVNCIRRTADGRLAGHNTDVIGLRAALNELLGAAQPRAGSRARHGRRFAGRAVCPCRTRHPLCAGLARSGERQLHLRRSAV